MMKSAYAWEFDDAAAAARTLVGASWNPLSDALMRACFVVVPQILGEH